MKPSIYVAAAVFKEMACKSQLHLGLFITDRRVTRLSKVNPREGGKLKFIG